MMYTSAINYTPRTRIRLGGFLGQRYGKVHHMLLSRGDANEATRALEANFPGFTKDLINAEGSGLRFAVFKNGRNIDANGMGLGGARELVFMPILAGSKRGGTLQTIVGAVMVAAAFVLSFTPLAAASPFLYAMGASMMVGGVLQMLSPQAKGLSQSGNPENMPSYAFGSAKNTTASGNPVPICIGYRRWGGAVISASIVAEDKA